MSNQILGKLKTNELLHVIIPAFRYAYLQTYRKHKIARFQLDILAQARRLSLINTLYIYSADIKQSLPGTTDQQFYGAFKKLVDRGYFVRLNKHKRWGGSHKYTITGSGIQIIDNFVRLLRKELSKQTFHDFFPDQSIHTI